MGRKPNLTGKVFWYLTVVEEVKERNKRGSVIWKCVCKCGAEVFVTSNGLLQGYNKSCGCYKTEWNKEHVQQLIDGNRGKPKVAWGDAAFKKLYRGYVNNAKARGFEMLISVDDFAILTSKNCHYCNSPPRMVSSTGYDTGVYIYNGLDRLDSTKDYTIDNVVPCCKWCNRAKSTMTETEFAEWITQVYEHFINDERKAA